MTLNRLWAEYLTAVENSWPLSERRQAIEDAIRKDERERVVRAVLKSGFRGSEADDYTHLLVMVSALLSTTTEEPQ